MGSCGKHRLLSNSSGLGLVCFQLQPLRPLAAVLTDYMRLATIEARRQADRQEACNRLGKRVGDTVHRVMVCGCCREAVADVSCRV